MRNKIYELVLNLHRPVYLARTRDLYHKHVKDHIANCPFTEHPVLTNLTRSYDYPNKVTWCVNPFTNTRRKLAIPRSVLSLRHVCNQIALETKYIFFATNEFHFRDAQCVLKALSWMADATMTAAIRVMCFRFVGENATVLYAALAVECPNLRVLRVMMSYGQKHVIIKPPCRSLRKARGVTAFTSYVAGLENLEKFEMVGTDYVDMVVNGVVQQVAVDINHPDAIAAWLRKKIELAKVERERIKREKIERERIEREKIEREKIERERVHEEKAKRKGKGKGKRAAAEEDAAQPPNKKAKTKKTKKTTRKQR